MKRIIGVEFGLIVLIIAFMISLIGGFGVTWDLGYKIVDKLQAIPDQHTWYIQNAFLFLFLPPLVGLTFYCIAYAWEIKSPTGILQKKWLCITAIGVFFFVWGVYETYWTLYSYGWNMNYATESGLTQTASLLPDIYITVAVANAFWISAGILLMTSLIFKIIFQTKHKNSKTKV